jgi:hypothetical protein
MGKIKVKIASLLSDGIFSPSLFAYHKRPPIDNFREPGLRSYKIITTLASMRCEETKVSGLFDWLDLEKAVSEWETPLSRLREAMGWKDLAALTERHLNFKTKSKGGPPLNGFVLLDSAYAGKLIARHLDALGVESFTHRKGCCGRKLNRTQKKTSKGKSRIRARVEYHYGWMFRRSKWVIRSIGMAGSQRGIRIANMVCNMDRITFLRRRAG